MSSRFLQLERWIRIACGYVIFPLLFMIVLWKAGMQEYNITGLLNNDTYSLLMKISSLIILAWFIRTSYIIRQRTQLLHNGTDRWLFLFSICTIGAVFTPYIPGSLSADIHLLFSYAALIFFNLLFYDLTSDQISIRNIYFAGLFFCALLCFTAGEITGLAELIFACMVSVLMTSLSK